MWVVSSYSKNSPMNLSRFLNLYSTNYNISGYHISNKGFYIAFYSGDPGDRLIWEYDSEEDRDKEYNNILLVLKRKYLNEIS